MQLDLEHMEMWRKLNLRVLKKPLLRFVWTVSGVLHFFFPSQQLSEKLSTALRYAGLILQASIRTDSIISERLSTE